MGCKSSGITRVSLCCSSSSDSSSFLYYLRCFLYDYERIWSLDLLLWGLFDLLAQELVDGYAANHVGSLSFREMIVMYLDRR
jgi:hypothetical protein